MLRKTLGSSDIRIMFREILPNLSSLIIVNLILRLAGNIGIETGLTYLGFGLPFTTPSLGTLISAAKKCGHHRTPNYGFGYQPQS